MLFDQVIQTLENKCLLDKARPVLVGVSGGPDSLCLLDLFQRSGYPLVVAHFNHRLRAEAGEDARFVGEVAARMGLPFALGEGDVRAYAAQKALSIEEAARILRYGFLFEQARRAEAQAVAVAHTADDQVETMLMHWLRGAGLSGLKGMTYRSTGHAWDARLPLVRPLLGAWREEILAYCRERGLQPHFDQTNLDTTYFRNRLRHELIPSLEGYNPRFRQVLLRTAQSLAGDYDVLEQVLQAAWQDCLAGQGSGAVALWRPPLQKLLPGLQRGILRRAMALLRPGLPDVDFDTVERALAFLAQPTLSGQMDLSNGLRIFDQGEKVFLADWQADLRDPAWPQVAPGKLLELNVPGRAALEGGWSLSASLVEVSPELRAAVAANGDPLQAWLDFDPGDGPLAVRGRRPGDRFEPLGMGGHSIKLSDYFINVKLAERARGCWPLILLKGEIAWVAGYRIAHPFRLTDTSRRGLHLRLLREEAQLRV